MTGNIIPQLGFGGTLADGSGELLLEKLNGLNRELGFDAYTDGWDRRIAARYRTLLHGASGRRGT